MRRRSRSAYLRQTWHTHLRQKPLQGRPPFQVCASLADLAHLPLSEAAPRQATAPGLHGFDRPGTSTSVRSRSRACHRSRSAYLRQTWHTTHRQKPLQGRPPFQVCDVLTDLAHLPPSEAAPRQAAVLQKVLIRRDSRKEQEGICAAREVAGQGTCLTPWGECAREWSHRKYRTLDECAYPINCWGYQGRSSHISAGHCAYHKYGRKNMRRKGITGNSDG